MISGGFGRAGVNSSPFYDPGNAIRKFYGKLGWAAYKVSTAQTILNYDGAGGLDYVFVGTSITAGTGTSNQEHCNWVSLFRNAVQFSMNPPPTTSSSPKAIGGFGTTMAANSTGGSAWGTESAMYDSNGGAVDGIVVTNPGDGRVAKKVSIVSGAQDPQYRFTIRNGQNESIWLYRRTRCTDIQILAQKTVGAGTLQYDIATGTWPASGGGNVAGRKDGGSSVTLTGTIALDAATDLKFVGTRLTFDAAATNAYLTVRPTVAACVVDGVTTYFEDWKCGHRFHNMSKGGCRLTHYNTLRWDATVAQFCTKGLAGGATNAGVVFIELMANDMGADGSAATDVTTWSDNLESRIIETLAWNSDPLIVLCITWPLSGAGKDALHKQFSEAVYSLASKYQNDVAVLDFHKAVDNLTNAQLVSAGYLQGDTTHPTEAGQEFMARTAYRALHG